jgi:hypothetical protein
MRPEGILHPLEHLACMGRIIFIRLRMVALHSSAKWKYAKDEPGKSVKLDTGPSGPPISTPALGLGGTSGPRTQCLSTWQDEVFHACHSV